jgi:hypothetical protein
MIHKLKLPASGKVVRFKELTGDEELQAFRLVGDAEQSMMAKGMRIILELVRLSIVTIDDAPVTYEAVVGKKLYDLLPSRDVKFLQAAYQRKCGDPSQEELDSFFKMELVTEI